MVIGVLVATAWSCWPLATENASPLIDQLDGATKAKVLAALAALVILGFAMMLLAWLGGRAVKRYMNSGSRSQRRAVDVDDWALKSMLERDTDLVDE